MLGFCFCGVLTLLQPVEQFSATVALPQDCQSFHKFKVKVRKKSDDFKAICTIWFHLLGIIPNLVKPNVLLLSNQNYVKCSIKSTEGSGFNVLHKTGQGVKSGQATKIGREHRLSQLTCS
jgi:hypothetical protein